MLRSLVLALMNVLSVFRRVALGLLFIVPLPLAADTGLMVVGLEAASGEWKLFIQPSGGEWQPIDTDDEPRTPLYIESSRQTIYADSGGNIRSRIDNQEQTLFRSNKSYSLTQPAIDNTGERLYMVALKDGASLDTDILQGNFKTGKLNDAVIQRSAQFEPFLAGQDIYYSTVTCVPPACHRIIEDIWRMNPVSRVAEQLTRTNAISREPVVDSESGQLFFISDKTGRFRLHTLVDGDSVALTHGDAIDSSPAIADSGDVLFIQRKHGTADGIGQWSKTSQKIQQIEPPKGVVKLRDLSTW